MTVRRLLPSRAVRAILSLPRFAAVLDRTRKEGINDGVLLAAQLVRDHVLSPEGERIADFLEARAERVAWPRKMRAVR